VAANLSAPQATYTGRSSLGMSTALRRGLEEPGCGQKPILDHSRRRQPVDRVVDGKPARIAIAARELYHIGLEGAKHTSG
jgi:hypothetical protein